jgi:hypothetical protein
MLQLMLQLLILNRYAGVVAAAELMFLALYAAVVGETRPCPVAGAIVATPADATAGCSCCCHSCWWLPLSVVLLAAVGGEAQRHQ